MIQAGSTDSVIPDTAFCKGTVRTFDTKLQSHVQNKMDKLLQGLSLSNDITYELEYIKGYLPVHNHQQSYDVVKQAANDLHLRFNESDLMMIGQDQQIVLFQIQLFVKGTVRTFDTKLQSHVQNKWISSYKVYLIKRYYL